MAENLYQGDSRTYLLTITDEDGVAPTGGTLNWTIELAVKWDDDDTTEQITKSSSDPTQIEPASPNPDSNKWWVYFVPADTVALNPGEYVMFSKGTTAAGKVHTLSKDSLPILAQGVA